MYICWYWVLCTFMLPDVEFIWSVGIVPLEAFHSVPTVVYCTRPLHKDVGPTINVVHWCKMFSWWSLKLCQGETICWFFLIGPLPCWPSHCVRYFIPRSLKVLWYMWSMAILFTIVSVSFNECYEHIIACIIDWTSAVD